MACCQWLQATVFAESPPHQMSLPAAGRISLLATALPKRTPRFVFKPRMDNVDNDFVEVSPPGPANRWRELVLDTGAAQSTLYDFKLAESAGGFTFADSNAWSTPTCDRFIFWKASNDILELTEQSMDLNLTGNQLRLRFQKTPVLEGVTIHETPDQIYILVATVGSVHRLALTHPRKSFLNIGSRLPGQSTVRQSIFANVFLEQLQNPNNFAIINASSGGVSIGMPIPVTSCSWLTKQREAVFVVANTSGYLQVVRLGSPEADTLGKVATWELKQTTIMGRLWQGLVPAIIRGSQEGDDAAVSLVPHQTQDDCFIFALCRDLRIRMWSYKRQECLLVHHLFEQHNQLDGDSSIKNRPPMAIRRPVILRKCFSRSSLLLSAFVAGTEQRQFFIYEFILDDNNYKLSCLATINTPQTDLVDFILTDNELWTLWLDSENSLSLMHCLTETSSTSDWKRVPLHWQLPQKTNFNSLLVDPRSLFIEDIFWSGKFSLQTISKAISIMKRVPESSYAVCKIEMLAEEAIRVVENSIRSQVGVDELSVEEYTGLVLGTWNTLHSYCVQYHNFGNKPLGIFLDPKTGLVGVVKKSNISLLRKVYDVDQAIVNSQLNNPYNVFTFSCEDPTIISSVSFLLKNVNIISEALSSEDIVRFELELSRGQKAEVAALMIIEDSLISATDPFSKNSEPLKHAFNNFFERSPKIVDAIDFVLKKLDLSNTEISIFDAQTISTLPILSQFLSSNNGLAILTESVKQMSRLRFNFVRDLLLLEHFVVYLRNKSQFINENQDSSISAQPSRLQLEGLDAVAIPQTAELLQAYFFMTWLCETSMGSFSVGSVSIEQTAAHLAILELNEYINVNRSDVSSHFDAAPRSILNEFMHHNGAVLAKGLLSKKLSGLQEDEYKNIWTQVLPLFVTSVAEIVWPMNNQMYLAEFFLGFGHYKILERYIQLLDEWCQSNVFSRVFLKAFCQLVLGESSKAVIYFNKAISGITDEPFLKKMIHFDLDEDESCNDEEEEIELTPQLVFNYYNKLIQLFKLYLYTDSVIDLTDAALGLIGDSTDECQKEVSCLYSILFMCHLDLGNTAEAYQMMVFNPDLSQQKICLRQFIVNHCENGKLGELILYSYKDIEDEFINIIESRARSTDLMLSDENSYYQILYSYFIEKNNYRKAASVMYEFARRLSHEVPGVESIEKQANSYLITLNCLKIVNQKYSWIIKPTAKKLPSTENAHESSLSKRNHQGDELDGEDSNSNGLTITVLDIEDIRKEYELVKARLRLLQRDAKAYAIANTPLTASETIIHLIAASMFDTAFHICKMFQLSYVEIFSGIVSKYIQVMQSNISYDLVEFYDNCFVENDTASLGYINSADLRPIDKMWHLIITYLETYEEPKQTVLHRCVAEKLLEAGLPLPTLLKLSYQKRNTSELIHILMVYDCLEEAVDLSIEHLQAYMGRGTDNFDISTKLLPNSTPTHIPFHRYDALLKILKEEEKDEPEYKKLHVKLNDQVLRLQNLARQCSKKTATAS